MKDLALHILDIAQNAIKAEAKAIYITIEDKDDNSLDICVSDNGKGIPPKVLANVTDPYTTSRTTRKVGLGIPLFKQNAERSGGYLNIVSEVGKGTQLNAHFQKNNIDCLPLGDVAGVIALLVNANPNINFKYTHTIHNNTYTFNTLEIRAVLGDIPINTPEIYQFIKEMIKENITELYNTSILK